MRQAEPHRAATLPRGVRPGRSAAMLVTCGGAHLLHDGLSNLMYVLLPIWARGFGPNLTRAGALKTAFSGVQASLQVPVGILSERLGERGLLVGGTAAVGLGYLALGTAGGYWTLLLLLGLTGMGLATQHPLSSTLISAAYEDNHRRAALGTYNFAGDVGKVLVPGLAALALGAAPWPFTTTGLGVLGLLAALSLLLALQRIQAPREHRPAAPAGPHSPARGWGVRDWPGFTALTAVGVIDSSARGGVLVLLPFLLTARGASIEFVGLSLSLVFAGGACGKFVCGLVAERLGIVRTVVLTELLTAAGIAAVGMVSLEWLLLLLPALGVALNGTSSVLYATVADLVEPERRARAFGLFYTFLTGSSSLAPVIYGALGDLAGIPTAFAGIAAVVLMTLPLCWWLRV